MDSPEEFLEWMKANTERLRRCEDATEMAELAVMGGASIELACKMLSQGHIDILTRSTERTRQKYYLDDAIKQNEMNNGKPDLAEQWLDLANQLIWGDDFKEAI